MCRKRTRWLKSGNVREIVEKWIDGYMCAEDVCRGRLDIRSRAMARKHKKETGHVVYRRDMQNVLVSSFFGLKKEWKREMTPIKVR